MVDSAARVCRRSCGCGCLTVTAEGEQCWWHGPLLWVPSGAAAVRQTAAPVVESTIWLRRERRAVDRVDEPVVVVVGEHLRHELAAARHARLLVHGLQVVLDRIARQVELA